MSPSASPAPATRPGAFAPLKAHAHQHDGFACACGHDHSKDGDGGGHSHSGVGLDFQLTVLLPLAIAALVLAGACSWFTDNVALANFFGLAATAIAGGPIIWSAIKGLSRGQTNVNELVAMSIIGAVSLGWYVEAGLVALILQIGALIEGVATESAQKAVLELQKLAPKHARIRRQKSEEQVIPVDELRVGDILVVEPGERLAADGKLVSGATSVDESSVTGESMPVDKGAGSEMLAGTINLTGSAEVRVERVGEHSALGQTIALVRRAQQFQPKIIRAADKFFAFYTPIILVASALAWFVTKDPVRMVTMWVVGCPCAMLLASPMAIVVSLARASRSGMQVKAGPFVEASATLQTVVFDKTGTLTTGRFIVSQVRPAEDVDVNDLLRIAATIEQRSSHPIARSIVAHARGKGIFPSEAADMQVLEGLGVRATVAGEPAVAGSSKIIPAEYASAAGRLDDAEEKLPVVPVYVMHGGRLLGAVFLTDEIRPEASRTVTRLRDLGIKRVAMLTGDRRRTAELVARAVGCDEVFAELMPGQKVEIVRGLQRGGRGVCMVGDGINDAPSLAAATVGVAMGVRGTDVAIEAADAVLLKDDLTRVPLLIYLAKRTRTAIYQNLLFSLVFAGLAEAAAAGGLFGPVVAALVHIAGVGVIAVNSVRLAGGGARKRKPVPAAVEKAEETTSAKEAAFTAPRFTPLQSI
ncbi:MAG TPA: cation-translocating P-type ATPase [Phycisphaerae bacterium]|nr:cation-translocating P-type ATPase [Phycisphaerae bacterium]